MLIKGLNNFLRCKFTIILNLYQNNSKFFSFLYYFRNKLVTDW